MAYSIDMWVMQAVRPAPPFTANWLELTMAELHVCRTCGESKPRDEFYTQKNGTRFHDCKPCWRTKTKANRAGKIGYYREYDRNRNDDPDRVVARNLYRKRNPRGSDAAKKAYYQRNKEKKRANVIVKRALERGDLIRQPCERCGNLDVEAHHEDYSEPLVIVWLCPKHHGARHRELNEERRWSSA
jgi:hypothetical protein